MFHKMLKVALNGFDFMANPKFHGGEKHQVPFGELFQSRTGTTVEPLTFCKLSRKFRQIKNHSLRGFERTEVTLK